jgi:hypothetical protein
MAKVTGRPIHLTLPLSGGKVIQCRFDYALTVIFLAGTASYELRVEAPLGLTTPTSEGETVLDPEGPPVLMAPALSLLHLTVGEATAGEDGRLHISFQDGHALVVPASPECEAWDLVGPNGYRIVCAPGGELVLWSSDDAPESP